MLLFIGFVSDTGVFEYEIKVGEVAVELVRLLGIEFWRGTVTSSRHQDHSCHSVVWWWQE
jgi:hypothetical protein